MLDSDTFVAPRLVANWFINFVDRDAGDTITHLKLQKLIYYAEAWFLAHFDRSLIEEDLQAWTHGPVSPSVYAHYKNCGWDALAQEKPKKLPDEVGGFLASVYKEYGQFTAKKLESMTHAEAPWKLTRGNLPLEARCEDPIDKLVMRNFYAARLGKKQIKKLRYN